MEEWEEGSVVSDRSSVISDLEELEANLYSYVHHERNDLFDKNELNECFVLPLEGQRQIIYDDSGDLNQQHKSISNGENGEDLYPQYKSASDEKKSRVVVLQSKSVGKKGEFAEEKKDTTSIFQNNQIEDIRTKNNVCQDFTENQFLDSKYKVLEGIGKHSICLSNQVVRTSVCNAPKAISDSNPTHIICDNTPQVIDVFSSSDEGANKETQLKTHSKETPFDEVVISDSDSDIKIEMEKIIEKPKKRKKKKKSKANDIMLNTVTSSAIISLDDEVNGLMPETVCFESILSNQQENASIKDQKAMNQSPLCNNWTPQMTRFYNESWGGEYINLSEIQKSMSDKGWNLDVSDEFSTLSWRPQDRRYFGERGKGWCTNCNRKGHFRNACPEATRGICCYRCGSSRHEESRCNNTICLTCGEKTKHLVTACRPCLQERGKSCTVCDQPGHPSDCCPDLWRRFHATIIPGKAVRPKKVLYKDSKNTYCCNCAKRGHHVYQCKKKTFSDYIPLTPYVISYTDLPRLKEVTGNSENWESVGGIAPEERNGKISSKRNNKKEKRGTKRTINHDLGSSNSKFIKLNENNDNSLERDMMNDSYNIPTGKKNRKKKNKPKVKKNQLKQSIGEYNGSILNNTATRKKDVGVCEEVTNGVKSKTFYPKKPLKVRNYFTVAIPISRNMYRKMNRPEGRVVIDYVLKEVGNLAISIVQDQKKCTELLLEGERTSANQAKALMRRIMFDKEVWNTLTRTIEGEKKLKPTDLRVEIKNKPNNSRNVTYKNDIKLSIPMKSIKGKGKKSNHIPKNHIPNNGSQLSQNLNKIEAENAKKTIQGTARTILAEKGISPKKMKGFADWALSVHGKVLNGILKYHLSVLSKITDNGKPIKYFKKHLVNIANLSNIPLVGKQLG